MRLIVCLAVALASAQAFAESGPGGEALHRLGVDRLAIAF